MEADDLLARVSELLGDAVIDSHARLGDATVLVDAERILAVLRTLRDSDLRFNFLIDLTGVDYLGQDPRFEVVYHLAAIDTEPHGTEPSRVPHRLRVKARVSENP